MAPHIIVGNERKSFDAGGVGLTKPWEALVEELNKCDLVCANDHVRRHLREAKAT
jgi:hypothetical protein